MCTQGTIVLGYTNVPLTCNGCHTTSQVDHHLCTANLYHLYTPGTSTVVHRSHTASATHSPATAAFQLMHTSLTSPSWLPHTHTGIYHSNHVIVLNYRSCITHSQPQLTSIISIRNFYPTSIRHTFRPLSLIFNKATILVTQDHSIHMLATTSLQFPATRSIEC